MNPTGKGGFGDRPQDINRSGNKTEAGEMLRAAYKRKLTPKDAEEVIDALIRGAKRGNSKDREHLFALAGIDLNTITLNQQHKGELKVTVVYERRIPDHSA